MTIEPHREQLEQLDVELEMKRELLADFQRLERVVAVRSGLVSFTFTLLDFQPRKRRKTSHVPSSFLIF